MISVWGMIALPLFGLFGVVSTTLLPLKNWARPSRNARFPVPRWRATKRLAKLDGCPRSELDWAESILASDERRFSRKPTVFEGFCTQETLIDGALLPINFEFIAVVK